MNFVIKIQFAMLIASPLQETHHRTMFIVIRIGTFHRPVMAIRHQQLSSNQAIPFKRRESK